VGYVDLRRRQAERARRTVAGPPTTYPYLLLAVGFVLGLLASLVFYIAVNGPDPVGTLLLSIAAVTLLGYLVRPAFKPDSGSSGPKPGAEKQLLLAILDAGSITPVDAALETSLTVDEAAEILTRLAERGHLLVHSRDGVLLYALPGGPTPSKHATGSASA